MPNKSEKDELGTEMEALAVQLAKSMSTGGKPAKEVIDAFGKLTSYYAATRKLNLKATDPEDEGTTFDGIRKKLAGPTVNRGN